MTQIIVFAIALSWLIGAAAFDITMTRRGIVKKLAVEGNSWIVGLFGNTPSTFDLYLYDGVIWCLMVAPAIVWGNPAAFGVSVGSMFAFGGGHILGGLKWRLLLQGKPLPTKSTLTAWQKFLGWFGYNW